VQRPYRPGARDRLVELGGPVSRTLVVAGDDGVQHPVDLVAAGQRRLEQLAGRQLLRPQATGQLDRRQQAEVLLDRSVGGSDATAASTRVREAPSRGAA